MKSDSNFHNESSSLGKSEEIFHQIVASQNDDGISETDEEPNDNNDNTMNTDNEKSCITDLNPTPKLGVEEQELQKTEVTEKQPLPKDTTAIYSCFSSREKKLIIIASSLSALFSPMSANIYLPALTTLADDLSVSSSLINLSVTTYLIFQGIAPSLFAGVADKFGRRPTYMLSFAIYIIDNIGLALQKNYAALLVLRCVQSAGVSSTVTLSYAVVADVVTSAERGKYLVYNTIPIIVGPSLSPIIGGLLSAYLGWRSIFWFLTICAGCFVIPFMLFFPETGRNIVGDGSIEPPTLNKPFYEIIKKKMGRQQNDVSAEKEPVTFSPRQRFRPFESLRIIFTKPGILLLISNGLIYANYQAIATSASQQFTKVYGFNDIQVGLVFLPLSAGGIFSALILGKLVDYNYRRHAKRLGFPIDKKRAQDLTNFPIERARLEVGLPALSLGVAMIVLYGWIMQIKTTLAAPLILLFFISIGLMAGLSIMNALMIDIFVGKAIAASAANNLVRCLLGAAASAVVSPMTNAMGSGWMQTCFGLIWVLYIPAIILVLKKGPQWRIEMKEKNEREAAAKVVSEA